MILTKDVWLNMGRHSSKRCLGESNPGPTNFWLPFGAWVCYTGSMQVAKQFNQTIRLHLNGLTTRKYWSTKMNLSPAAWTAINWDLSEGAYTKSSLAKNAGPHIFQVDILPIGKICSTGIFV